MEPRHLLRALMEKSGDNPNSLAAKLNGQTQQPQIYKFLEGISREPRRSTLQPIANHYGVPVEAFYDEALAQAEMERLNNPGLVLRKPMQEIDLENHPDVQAIKTVKLKLRAGIHGFAVEGDTEMGMPTFLPTEWLVRKGYKPEALLGLPVCGDSMEPTLYAGDKVVINTASKEPRDGVVFAINYEGESIIKRLHRDESQWWLISDNSDQRRYPKKLCADAGCLLLGEVIYRQTERI